MTFDSLAFQKTNHVVWLTLNRPAEANSIDSRLAAQLVDACQAVNQDEEVWVVVLTGEGRWFCSGLDFADPVGLDAHESNWRNRASTASGAVAGINCPVVAAINGDAVGAGLELALACDIRLAVDSARLGFTETAYGLMPGGGGTQRLPRLIGKGKATEMLLTADLIDAAEAQRCGLVISILPAADLLGETDRLADKLASRAPIATRYAKEAVYKGMDMTLDQGLRLEADLSFLLQSTGDRAEGIHAFTEKRQGQFHGR